MRPWARPRGFTLLELLTAASITVLLVGLILAVTGGALNLWRRTQGGYTMITEATLALDLLERDLQASLQPASEAAWLVVALANDTASLANRGWLTEAARLKPGGTASLRPWPEPDAPGERRLAEARSGLSGAWLRVLTTTAESGSESALPRAVAWQIARRPVTGPVAASNPAPVRYTLFRSALGVATTFANGYDLTSAAYGSTTEAPGPLRAPSTLANPNPGDALAANVVDFGLWLYRRQPDGRLVRIFPTSETDTAHLATRGDPGSIPEVADVMVRVLTDEGAQQVALIETGRVERPPVHGSDADWWWAVVEAHSRVFIRRVELMGGGP